MKKFAPGVVFYRPSLLQCEFDYAGRRCLPSGENCVSSLSENAILCKTLKKNMRLSLSVLIQSGSRFRDTHLEVYSLEVQW